MKTNVIKQDINFLDKPLWFQDIRHEGLGFTWTDVDGYLYRTTYKPPDKVDILILFYLLLKSQMKEYSAKVETSRYEILKECGLPARVPKYCERLEDSLRRWMNVGIEFHGTFYDGRDYISIGFGIIDGYRIDKITKRVTVQLNPDWLLKLKESNFFKYINFDYYKALRRPISRRLWELLCKTFKGRTEWKIHLTKLGAKLPIAKRKVITQEGEKEVLYASDVLTAIKPGINDINRLAKIPGIAATLGILEEDLFTLTYKIEGKKQDRVVHFYKHLVNAKKVESTAQEPILQAATSEPKHPNDEAMPSTVDIIPELAATPKQAQSKETRQEITPEIQATYWEALDWLDTIAHFDQRRKREIAMLPIGYVAERYPSIKSQYEKMARTGKKPGPGWVYDAFKNGYQFAQDIKKSEAQDQEKQYKSQEEKIAKIRQLIEKKGIQNVLYHNCKICDVSQIGLSIKDDEGCDRVAVWCYLKLEDFTVVEERN